MTASLNRIIRQHQKQAFVGATGMDTALIKLQGSLLLTQEMLRMAEIAAQENAYPDASTITRTNDMVIRAMQGVRTLLTSAVRTEANKLVTKLLTVAQR